VFPNIKQRTNAKKGKNRKKAAKIFNASKYHFRGWTYNCLTDAGWDTTCDIELDNNS
jgi:hypothetical protein